MPAVSITLKEEFTKASNWPPAIARSIPFMLQEAMAKGAKKSADSLSAQMARKLHQPKKRTVNGVFPKRITKPSTKKLVVVMGLRGGGPKDEPGGRDGSPAWYLKALIKGSRRTRKASESVLHRSNKLKRNQYIVPTNSPSFPLNTKGNLTGGKYTQVLSRIKAHSEMGYTANTTKGMGSRGRSGRKRSAVDFFIGSPGNVGDLYGKSPWMQYGIQKRVGPRPAGNPGGRGRPVTTNLPRGFNTIFWIADQAPRYRRMPPVGTILTRTFDNVYTPEMTRQIREKIKRIMKK